MSTILIGLLMVAIMLGMLAGIHYYLWRRLVRDTTVARTWPRRVGSTVLIVMPLLGIAAMLSTNVEYQYLIKQIVSWPGFLWWPVLMFLVLGLLVLEPLRWWLYRRTPPVTTTMATQQLTSDGSTTALAEPEPAETPDMVESSTGATRRQVISRAMAVGVGVVSASTVAYGSYAAFRTPRLLEVDVTLDRLSPSDDGYRLAVISDLHLSAVRGRAQCERIVSATVGMNPDAITVVGDIVDGTVNELESAAEPLADLIAPDGTYFVTGNHEYYLGARPWVDYLRGFGWVALENERVPLSDFDLAGVNDLAAGMDPLADEPGPDVEATMQDRDPDRAVIMMAHQPELIYRAQDRDVDLLLSGHTHGGQIWPATYIAGAVNPTLAGLEAYGDTQLYVTRGAGTWGPPVRVGAPSDITVLTLRSR